MKKIIVMSILIFFQYYLILAVETDSTISAEHDSLNSTNSQLLKENQDDDKWFYWTGVVGIGTTLHYRYTTYYSFELKDGPATSFGLELAFSKNRDFCFEINNFVGLQPVNEKNLNAEGHLREVRNAMKIKDSLYLKNLALTLGIKFKIMGFMENDKLKIMGHLNTYLLPMDLTPGIFLFYNLGLSINYSITNKVYLSLVGRTPYQLFIFAQQHEVDFPPNLLLLNYCYNF